MAEQWDLILKELVQTDRLQWLAVSLGIAEVLLAKANRIWLYPTGIASVILTALILYNAGLYAECLLNAYYLVMSVYGWWYWVKKKDRPKVKISVCSRKDRTSAAIIVVVSFVLLAFLLKKLTPSTVPYWDAWVSATAWAGMWLLAKRKIENWIVLNVSNAFAIPLLLYKQLPLYALLTAFLFFVAIQGYIRWHRLMQKDPAPDAYAIE